MRIVPASEIANRIVALQALLRKDRVDAAVIRQNADLFYFTGTVQDSHLIVPCAGNPVSLVRRSLARAEAEPPPGLSLVRRGLHIMKLFRDSEEKNENS